MTIKAVKNFSKNKREFQEHWSKNKQNSELRGDIHGGHPKEATDQNTKKALPNKVQSYD